MDAYYGEVETSGHIAGKTFYDFRLLPAVENADNDSFRYAEVIVPQGFVAAYNDSRGIHVVIPYTPDTRRLMVRFVIENGSGGTEYLRNAVTGKYWYPVVVEQNGANSDVSLSAYCELNGNGVFNLLLRDGYLALYSGEETDFEIGRAKAQNEAFLLKAATGNLYQHPTTGVGLIDFLHSNLEFNNKWHEIQEKRMTEQINTMETLSKENKEIHPQIIELFADERKRTIQLLGIFGAMLAFVSSVVGMQKIVETPAEFALFAFTYILGLLIFVVAIHHVIIRHHKIVRNNQLAQQNRQDNQARQNCKPITRNIWHPIWIIILALIICCGLIYYSETTKSERTDESQSLIFEFKHIHD